MTTVRIFLLIAALGALMAGCGRQGDLVRPAPLWGSPPPGSAAPDPGADEAEDEADDPDAPPEIDSPD